MQPRVVEEVKVCVLDKVTLGVPRMGGKRPAGALLWSFNLSSHVSLASQRQGLTSAKATQPLVGRPVGRVGSGVEGEQGAAHLEISVWWRMVPGGRVWGVSVLLMAMVMRQEDRGPLWTSLLMSASKGR